MAVIHTALLSSGLSAQPAPAKTAQTFPSKLAWSIELPAEPSTSPLVAGDRIFTALESGALSAWRLADGKEIWTVTRKADQPMSADDGRIIVAGDGAVSALETSDGKEIWKVESGKLTAPPQVRGGWVVVAETGKLAALRASDGQRIWEREFGEVLQRPAIDGGTLFVALQEGRLLALDLESGTPIWDQKIDPSPTEPAVYGDRVYLGDDSKRLLCLKAQTGETDFVAYLGFRALGRADLDDSHVYTTGVDNTLRAFDRINGALRWRKGVTYRPVAGPMVIGPNVFLGGLSTEIPGFDQKNGNPAGKLTLEHRLAVAPAVANPVPNAAPAGLVVITSEAGQPAKLSLAVAPEPKPAAKPDPVKLDAPKPGGVTESPTRKALVSR